MWYRVHSVDIYTSFVVEFAREVKGRLQYACVLHANLLMTCVLCLYWQVDLQAERDRHVIVLWAHPYKWLFGNKRVGAFRVPQSNLL